MKRPGGCWPTGDQELLLRAALLAGDAARSAWEAWVRSAPDLDDLDQGSLRLLPLLYGNLKALGIAHPRMALLKGVARKAWYQNRMLMADLAGFLAALAADGVPAVVLKGAALARTVYPALEARPMGDADVLVRVAEAARAVEMLRRLGMRPTHPLTPRRVPLVHSVGFVGAAGRQLDLHWHVVEEDCRPGADDGFWERAVTIDIDGVPALALDATDQLFQVCVHGVRWEATPPIRWVADATLLSRTGAIDWDRLVALGERHRLAPQLCAALGYLGGVLPVQVPERVIDGLGALPLAAWQRREFALKTRPHRYLRRLRFHWYNHRRQQESAGTVRRLATFPDYLLGRWGLDSVAEVPGFVVGELRRRRARERRATMTR